MSDGAAAESDRPWRTSADTRRDITTTPEATPHMSLDCFNDDHDDCRLVCRPPGEVCGEPCDCPCHVIDSGKHSDMRGRHLRHARICDCLGHRGVCCEPDCCGVPWPDLDGASDDE